MYSVGAACPVRGARRLRRPLGIWAAPALAAVLAAGCGAAELPCASDVDCAAGHACDLGQCVDPQRASVEDLRSRRVTIPASADGTVVSSTCCRTASFGGHDVLVVGGAGGGGVYRSYLSFDLEPLEGGEVAAARLRLTASPRWCLGAEPLELLAYAAGRSWAQGSLSWTGQPDATGGPLGRALLRPDHARVTVVDVTRLVASWVSGVTPNRGVMLRARDTRAGERVAWHSREAVDARVRPVLEVDVR